MDSDDRLTVATTQVVLKSIGTELVPVGVQTPAGWRGSLTLAGSVEWGAPDDTPPIEPGGQVAGFGLVSHGLPGLRSATVEAYVPLEELAIAPPSDESDLKRYDNELAALQAKLRVSTTTIGPTAPPADFKVSSFFGRIIDYRNQANRYGWIKDLGIGNSLDAKLKAAQAASERGQNSTAVNILNALVNEVDAQAGKQLSSEAVALLKFNTQYLITKLR